MNADEIVRALRCHMRHGAGCLECPKKPEQKGSTAVQSVYNCTDNMCRDAADLIESLQAQISASQRRADAAVEDLYMACKHTPCNTGVCTTKGCKGNRIPCEFEWRGPQEADV